MYKVHACHGTAHSLAVACGTCQLASVLQQEEADKVEAKRQQVVAAVASMAAALEAADAKRREAALNPPRPVAAPSAAAAAAGADTANAEPDAAAPMQADDTEDADQNEDAEPGLCQVSCLMWQSNAQIYLLTVLSINVFLYRTLASYHDFVCLV